MMNPPAGPDAVLLESISRYRKILDAGSELEQQLGSMGTAEVKEFFARYTLLQESVVDSDRRVGQLSADAVVLNHALLTERMQLIRRVLVQNAALVELVKMRQALLSSDIDKTRRSATVMAGYRPKLDARGLKLCCSG